MKLQLRPSAAVFSVFIGLALLDATRPSTEMKVTKETPIIKNQSPRIQAAILLDVSNSMDGLIAQAKAQLWNMVSVMGKAKCNEVAPKIEIALYEYGRDSNDPNKGYIKQISPFSSDLDQLSQNLFNLTTYGGSEYCGQVIHTSLDELKWDTSSLNYKVIFISGNEDFLQGNLSYTQACAEAKKKGVIVNTIYCGDKAQGIREHWNLGAECGSGSFTNINSDAKLEEIPTPFDTTLIVLNKKLNTTYMFYGDMGVEKIALQGKMDDDNARISSSVAAKRASVKGNAQLYDNASWDLVDAYKKDRGFIQKVDMKTLPDSLKNTSRARLEQIVDNNLKQRSAIQKDILSATTQREAYITKERAKRVTKDATLETEVEKMIREQAKRYNMVIH